MLVRGLQEQLITLSLGCRPTMTTTAKMRAVATRAALWMNKQRPRLRLPFMFGSKCSVRNSWLSLRNKAYLTMKGSSGAELVLPR